MAGNVLDLTGAVALVTGGNSGIGRATALTFAEAGASVAIAGRRSENNAVALKELQVFGNPAMAIELDVSDRDALEPAVRKVEGELGPVSVLVNNAGAAAIGGVLTVSFEDWDRVMATNLTAAFGLSKFVARSMVHQRRGKIINIASASAFFGYVRLTSYAVSKAALIHLTECMAVELGPFNVQANVIVPGWTETEMAGRMKATPAYQSTIDMTPALRWAEPQEIANAALFLASPASSFVNGATLTVDGGTTQVYGANPPDPNLPEW